MKRTRVWTARSGSTSFALLADEDTLDKLIIWRMGDPRYSKGKPDMMIQWVIEARADYADPKKNEVVKRAMQRAAAHVNAQMNLISDGQTPQVVCFSDDFFTGHEDIALIEDVLGKNLAAAETGEADDTVSDEMLAALRDVQMPKAADFKP